MKPAAILIICSVAMVLIGEPVRALELPYIPPEQQLPLPQDKIDRCQRVARNKHPVLRPRYIKLCMDDLSANWRPAYAGKEFEDKLYGFVWVNVDAAGIASVQATFSNGKKWRGEEGLGAIVRFLDDENKMSYVVSFRTAVGGAEFSKGAKEVHKNTSFQLEPAKWKTVGKIDVEWTRFITDAQFSALMAKGPPDFRAPIFIKTW